MVERDLVNEHGSIINFTVYKEPKDMEVLLLGKKGRVAQKKEKEQKYADINYILGYTKEGVEIHTREIQTTYDTKIKLSKLLEVLNEGEQVERKKIIIPIICLEEKSNGIVTVLDKENTLFQGEFNENEDDPTTPRGIYKKGERVQPDMLMGASPSPFKLTPDKYGEGSMGQKSMSSPPVWMKKNVSSLSRTSSESSLGKRTKTNDSNSSNNNRMKLVEIEVAKKPKLKLDLRSLENN